MITLVCKVGKERNAIHMLNNNIILYHFSNSLTPCTNVLTWGKPYNINFFCNNKINKRVL